MQMLETAGSNGAVTPVAFGSLLSLVLTGGEHSMTPAEQSRTDTQPTQHTFTSNRRLQQERRRVGCAFLAAVAALGLLIAVWCLLQFAPVQRRYIYPFPYRATVEQYAQTYQVDVHLAAAVIKVESKFQNDVHSHRGAVGLMQLMPETADWIAGQIDDKGYSWEALHEPQRNIRYGLWYLASLEEEFHGNDILALAAYNAGRGNVQEWIRTYGWGEDFHDVDAIPYAETREYVRQVLHDAAAYARLYPKE